MSEAVNEAQALGMTLKSIRIQELALRQERIRIREEWAVLHKGLKGTELRDATEAYWKVQGDE